MAYSLIIAVAAPNMTDGDRLSVLSEIEAEIKRMKIVVDEGIAKKIDNLRINKMYRKKDTLTYAKSCRILNLITEKDDLETATKIMFEIWGEMLAIAAKEVPKNSNVTQAEYKKALVEAFQQNGIFFPFK